MNIYIDIYKYIHRRCVCVSVCVCDCLCGLFVFVCGVCVSCMRACACMLVRIASVCVCVCCVCAYACACACACAWCACACACACVSVCARVRCVCLCVCVCVCAHATWQQTGQMQDKVNYVVVATRPSTIFPVPHSIFNQCPGVPQVSRPPRVPAACVDGCMQTPLIPHRLQSVVRLCRRLVVEPLFPAPTTRAMRMALCGTGGWALEAVVQALQNVLASRRPRSARPSQWT